MPASTISASEPRLISSRAPSLAGVAEGVLEHLPLGLVVIDRALRINFRNPAAEQLLPEGENVADVLSRSAASGLVTDWPAELRGAMDAQISRRFENVGFYLGAEGARLLDIEFIPLRSESSAAAAGAVLICQDVTQEAGLVRRLAASERMAAVGKLAARVAHELNNPLDGALRYVNLSLRLIEPVGHEQVIGYLRESRTGLMRMAHIVGDLLEYSRSLDANLEEANVNSAVDEAIRTFQERAAAQGVVLAAAFHDENMPSVRGAKLFQACCNLIKNAIDAMPTGGTLTITTGVVGREVVLKFEDTGVGLPEDRAAIFEPFFTTKPPGKGTGLGLAICKDYVARLNGSITAANRPEGGAVFTIRIPVESCNDGQKGAATSHA